MKVICVDAHWEATKGILGLGAKPRRPIPGLTEGKKYDVEVVNIVDGGGSCSVGNNVQFLIFNDNEEWETYSTDCFKPV